MTGWGDFSSPFDGPKAHATLSMTGMDLTFISTTQLPQTISLHRAKVVGSAR
jgi:hypothetical protein